MAEQFYLMIEVKPNRRIRSAWVEFEAQSMEIPLFNAT